MSLNDNPVSALGTGRLEISTEDKGKAIPLVNSTTPCVWVSVFCQKVGGDLVVGGPDTALTEEGLDPEGIPLETNNTITIPINDVAKVYVASAEGDAAVSFMYGVA